jgi:hypothetical protein
LIGFAADFIDLANVIWEELGAQRSMLDFDLTFKKTLRCLPIRQRITIAALSECKTKQEVLERITEREGRLVSMAAFDKRLQRIRRDFTKMHTEDVRNAWTAITRKTQRAPL